MLTRNSITNAHKITQKTAAFISNNYCFFPRRATTEVKADVTPMRGKGQGDLTYVVINKQHLNHWLAK